MELGGAQCRFRYFWRDKYHIIIYIQQDATLHSLFYLETALHVSGGTITHHQERKQLYLQHLVFVTPLLISAAIVEELKLVWVCCRWRTFMVAATAEPSQRPATINVCKNRGCNYSCWAPDDGRCVVRNMLRN
jgi:hypothetical protein